MSKLDDILNTVVAAQAALALRVETNLLGVVKRKLPKREETVDLGYSTTVSGSEMVDAIRRIAFGSCWSVVYQVEVTLITPNERDQLQNLTDHAAWREATRAFWMKPGSLAAVEAKKVEFPDGVFLDRSQLNNGYDYQQVVMRVTTYERRE